MQATQRGLWKLLERQMDAPETEPFAGGRVAYFTTANPDRTGVNEDAAGLFAIGPSSGALVVADGLGGVPSGESASRLAVSCVAGALERVEATDANLRGPMLDALENCNRQLLDQGAGSGTTFAALEIQEHHVRPYHVGDTSILLTGQRSKLKLWTVPHSPVGYAVESGMLGEREALYHDQRHVVSNTVGAADMRIEIGSPLKIARRDTALLATDGLFDNLSLDEIVEIIRIGPLHRSAERLVELALARMAEEGGASPCKPDDLTVVLYRPG
jgi:serine/threonine protein phosphatase PrpC